MQTKRKKLKYEVWSLDTEDDSKGNVKYINFFDGTRHYGFKTSSDAIRFLGERSRTVHIWTTNLSYDLVNLFRDHFGIISISYVGSRAILAQIYGTKIFFKDTLNHWKISVKEMGEKIGLKKLEEDLFEDPSKITAKKLISRCERDSEITRTFVVQQSIYYEKIGAELKSTIGSTALDFFHKKYHPKPKIKLKSAHIEFMLQGYYGGRTEIFHTKPVRGNILYHDFNSLYPSVMLENPYPIINNFGFTKKPNLENEGIAHAKVESPKNLNIPYLPLREPETKKLIFPLGTFEGHWTYFELRRAMEIGYRIHRIYQAVEFGAGSYYPFKGFVSELYDQRIEAQGNNDSLLAETLKLVMNNLYGKFGQGNEITKLIPFNKKDLKNGDRVYGDCIVRTNKGKYPEHTNVIWSAYTTAYGRDKLWRAMQRVEESGGTVLYCDTDSVLHKSKRDIFGTSKALGEFKLEKRLEYAHFKGLKLYCLIEKKTKNEIYRAKGVPRKVAKDFFLTGKASFRRPTRLRESLKRRITANYWSVTEKEHKSAYDKRHSTRTGRTLPIIIG